MQTTRIFNADVGDESVGNAGPDAIEQDLDNLYENKTWKEDVLTKNNTTSYIPSQNYHPATKKYVDDTKKEVTDALNIIRQEVQEALNNANSGVKYVGEYADNQALIMYILQNQLSDGIYTFMVNDEYLLGNIRYYDNILKGAIYGVNTITMVTFDLTTGTLEELQELPFRDIVSKDYLLEEMNNRHVTGTYTGAGTAEPLKAIGLTFEPCNVIIQKSTEPTSYTIIKGYDCINDTVLLGQITETGFNVADALNTEATNYNYIAFK